MALDDCTCTPRSSSSSKPTDDCHRSDRNRDFLVSYCVGRSQTLNRLEAVAIRLTTITCTLAATFTRQPLPTVANFCGVLNFVTVRAVMKKRKLPPPPIKITHYTVYADTVPLKSSFCPMGTLPTHFSAHTRAVCMHDHRLIAM